MSKHSRSGSPQRSASSAAAAAPPAGPLSTVSAAWSAAASSAGQAAAGLHDRRGRQAGVARGVEQAAQVAREQGGEGGVDLGRRRALELAEGADDLVRQRDVDAEALAQRVADRALVVGVAIAVQQADGDRLGLGAAPRASTSALEVGQRLEHAVGPGALARGEAPLGRRQRRRVRGAQPVELAPRLAAEGDDVGEAVGGARTRCARPCPRAARWWRPSCRGRSPRRRPPRAPAASSARSTAAMTPRDWSSGVVGALAVCTTPPRPGRRP